MGVLDRENPSAAIPQLEKEIKAVAGNVKAITEQTISDEVISKDELDLLEAKLGLTTGD